MLYGCWPEWCEGAPAVLVQRGSLRKAILAEAKASREDNAAQLRKAYGAAGNEYMH